MRRKTRMAFGLVALVSAAALWAIASYGAAGLERLVRRTLETVLPGRTTIGAVEVAWMPPSIGLREGALYGRDGEIRVRLPEVRATLGVWASLWEGAWIADVTVVEPEVFWREGDPFWGELRGGDTTSPALGGKPTFLPRKLAVRSGRLHWAFAGDGPRGRFEDVRIDGALQGFLEPAVSFEAESRGWIRRAGSELPLERLVLRGGVRRGQVTIDAMSLDTPGERLRASGSWSPAALAGHVRWEGSLDPVFALLPEAGRIGGGGLIEADLSGTFGEPVVEARLEARSVRIEDVEFSGTGRLRSEGGAWRLDSADVRIFGGRVEAEADGRWAGGIPYSVNGRFEDWDPLLFLELFDVDWPVRGRGSGRARLTGRLLADDLEGSGSFRLVDGDRAVDGTATFRVAETTGEVEGTLGKGSMARLDARYAIRDGTVSGEATLAGGRLSPILAFVGASDLDASGEVRLGFEGTTEAPAFRGDLDLATVRVGTGGLGGVRGAFRLAPGIISSDQGIEAFDGRMQFRGTAPLADEAEGSWTLELHRLPLDEATAAARVLWSQVPEVAASGTLHGSITGSGPGAAPRLRAMLTATELTIAGEGPFGISGSAARDGGAWNLTGELIGAEGLQLTARLVAGPGGELSGSIESDAAPVESFAFVRGRWPTLRGKAVLEGSIAGSVNEPRGSARVDLRDLVSAEEERLSDVSAALEVAGERVEIRAASGELWSLVGWIGLGEDFPFGIEARCASLDLQPFLVPGSDLAVRVTGNGRLRGALASEVLSDGVVRLEHVEISRGAVRVVNVEPLEARVRGGTLRLAPVTLRDTDQELTVEGTFGPSGSEASARGRGDLRLLEMLLPGVASARGAVALEVRARQAAGAPWHLFGTARVEDAAMDLGFLLGVTDVAGELRFDGSRVEVPGVTGRLGGGDFLIAGDLTRERGWDLGWAIRDANLAVPAWLDYRAAGNGRFRGPFEKPRLSGEIEIVQALYDRPVEWAEFLPWFRREATRSRQTASVPVELDLRIVSDGGLFVDNNLAEAELDATFEVRGVGDKVRWKGRLDVVSGEFVFRRRRFAITAGTVQFHERRPLNPDLDFRGETTISTGESDYEILVQVTGTAERPRVEFVADDPSLSENDILALVTFGRTVSQLQAQGAGFELSEVLALTAGPRAGKVEERIYEFIPIDRIEIQPTFSRTSGTTEPRLSIGKDLTPELRALLSTGLGAERQQDVALEYQLTPRISVQGAWESQTKSQTGAFGGDLKFRFPFRTFRDLSPLPAGDPDPP